MINSETKCAIASHGKNKIKLISIDEIGERHRLNHAIVVYLYYPYTQFPRNVRLISSANRDFFGASLLFDFSPYIYTALNVYTDVVEADCKLLAYRTRLS